MFEKVGLEKTIPGTPEGTVPVHLRKKQIFATLPQDDPEDRSYNKPLSDFMMELRLRDQLRKEFRDVLKEEAKAAS